MKIISNPCITLFLVLVLSGCSDNSSETDLWTDRHLSDDFKNYWFNGEAEITSYELVQSRYGEPRNGTAVMIYVTEDFLPEAQVKADDRDEDNIPVLKLNSTKNFITGIYPYSIMQSSFLPLQGNSNALKVTASIQEWCGQVFMQLNNRNNFQIKSHSYFEGEADEEISLPKNYLENEIWNQLRVEPKNLPVGEFKMIPSMEFIRLAHIELKEYEAFGEFLRDEKLEIYKITYPQLTRELLIYFERPFPHRITKWTETTKRDGKEYVTTATKIAEIKSAYWNKNSNNDLPLRDNLKLK